MDKDTAIVWFAMSAPYRRELIAQEFLEQRGIDCFVPMKEALVEKRNGSKRRQMVPAIHNLIFVHTTKETIKYLKQGVNFLQYCTRPVAGKNVPIIVPDYQMQQFIATCNTYNEKLIYLAPDEINLQEGTPVRIIGGAFDGIEGTFVRIEKGKRKKVVVMAEGIAAVAIAKFTDGFIQVLDK